MSKRRAIAFVLPQFHPIPENDQWWGKGFTEWTNVTKARPLFEGHYQPQLPADLGFYDLRLPEAREAQASLAKEHNIFGFCYYHYWFNGKRLLHKPLDDMLHLGTPNMPFMYCWANENWTRRWDGQENDILIEQTYSKEDDKEHIIWLCEQVFNDKRYITVNGAPVFMIYRHNLFPDIRETIALWRTIAVEEYGFPDLYLCMTESFNTQDDPTAFGFDASVEFSAHAILGHECTPKRKRLFLKRPKNNLVFKDFKKGVKVSISRAQPEYKFFRSVTPAWDNTARKGVNGVVALGSSPELYKKWLKEAVSKSTVYSADENFIFINAMNEWAEGNHLEPCIKYGLSYLEATKNILDNYK
ncbi:lipopolysaccharide biosynthesis protein [Ulvibacter sp. MAR_2010_11]|uniref:glycosyltransferase WbsX family protein n=1 Tax=Ulvibacter sp. MAR_2010_11 TaxID=1250229 RepID=UPI000C2B6DB4|nr:glycoside hydrolase family 99-like domain-containing protein [Ulvibacter sp. MAR_2010_11]PKA82128.1 lipopolysaccharide biosynthesis protein [Ulvibacter sp. MAR_2010_11]